MFDIYTKKNGVNKEQFFVLKCLIFILTKICINIEQFFVSKCSIFILPKIGINIEQFFDLNSKFPPHYPPWPHGDFVNPYIYQT